MKKDIHVYPKLFDPVTCIEEPYLPPKQDSYWDILINDPSSEFDSNYADFLWMLLQDSLYDMNEIYVEEDNQSVKRTPDEIRNFLTLKFEEVEKIIGGEAWTLTPTYIEVMTELMPEYSLEEKKHPLFSCYGILCLDYGLQAYFDGDLEKSAISLSYACSAMWMAKTIKWSSYSERLTLSNNARKAAKARLERSPKQSALVEIEAHYLERKSQFKRHGYTSQFIREMHLLYPIITDQKTIAKLVAKLNKTNDQIPR